MAKWLKTVAGGDSKCCDCAKMQSPCDCEPDVCVFECREKSAIAILCGYDEYALSVPPKRYRRKQLGGMIEFETYCVGFTGGCEHPAACGIVGQNATFSGDFGDTITLTIVDQTHIRLQGFCNKALISQGTEYYNAIEVYAATDDTDFGGDTIAWLIASPPGLYEHMDPDGMHFDKVFELPCDAIWVRVFINLIAYGRPDIVHVGYPRHHFAPLCEPITGDVTYYSACTIDKTTCAETVGGKEARREGCAYGTSETTRCEVGGFAPLDTETLTATRREISMMPSCVLTGTRFYGYHGTAFEDLSDEDTDADAIARAIAPLEWVASECTVHPAFITQRLAGQFAFTFRYVQVRARAGVSPQPPLIIGHDYEVTVKYHRRLLTTIGPWIFLGQDVVSMHASHTEEVTSWLDVPNEAGWETRAEICAIEDVTLI